MVSRIHLNAYKSKTLPKIVNLLSKLIQSSDFTSSCQKLSKSLLKLSLSLDPETIISVFSSIIHPSLPLALQKLMQDLFSFLFLKPFKSHSPILKFDQLFSEPTETKKCEFDPINDQFIAELQKIQSENEGLKRLLDDCNYFLNGLEENSLALSGESSERLKSLKTSLASKSTMGCNSKSEEKTEIIRKYNEKPEFSENLAGFLMFERAKILKMKTLGFITDTQLAIAETELVFTSNQPPQTPNMLLNTLESLSSSISSFHSKATQKLQVLNSSLTQLQILITDYKFSKSSEPEQKDLKLCQTYLKKVISDKEQLQDFYEDLKSEKKSLEIRFLKNTINLENQLKAKISEINSKHDQIQQLESKLESLQNSNLSSHSPQIEQLLITKLTLQGEISILESQNLKMRTQLESDEFKSKSFSSEFDGSKGFRLSDISENKQGIGKDRDIQELKEALRTVSDRYERDKENLLRDIEESRQDMEAQIFRLRQEKAYQESVCRDLQRHLQELSKEKELAEKELAWLRQVHERQVKSSKSSKFDNEVVSSFEFDISKSIDAPDGPNTLPYKTIQDAILEELNEISVDLKKKRKIDLNNVTIFELIKSTLAHMIKIQEAIETETSSSYNYRETSRNLSDVLSKLKLRIRNIEEESLILNKKVDQSEFDRVLSEPSIKLSDKEHRELLQYYKKQLQIEKAKVLEKKHVIKLHKEQIVFLKHNLREIQFELGKVKILDFEYIKDVFKSFIKEVPIFHERIEGIVGLLTKLFGFSEAEQSSVNDQRLSLNSSKAQKLIFPSNLIISN